VVDATARESAAGLNLTARYGPGAAWLTALIGDDPQLKLPTADAETLFKAWQTWARQTDAAGNNAFRIAFRLDAPQEETGGKTWALHYLLQATDDPSLIVPAGQIWRKHGDPYLQQRFDQPQERLLRGLAFAGRLFSPILDSLRSVAPESATFDTQQAHHFLQEAAPILQSSGFRVLLPRWWGGKKTNLTLRAKVSGGKQTGRARLTLDTLLRYEYQVMLGGQPIDRAEFMRLAALKQPLVQFRGQWVLLDPAQIEAGLRFFEQSRGELRLDEALHLGLDGDETAGGIPLEKVRADGWLKKLLDTLQQPEKIETLSPPDELHAELRPYQERGYSWLVFLRRYGLGACLADDMGLGKAEAVSARVYTPTGWKRMGDIQVGDRVINPEGGCANVVGVFPQGEQDIYRVTFSDGSSTRVTAEHLWSVNTPVRKQRSNPYIVMSTAEIAARGLKDAAGNRKYFIPMVEPVDFEEQSLPLDPYLLGALIGDGGLSKHSVYISTQDPEIAEAVASALPQGVALRHKGGYDFRISSDPPSASNPVMNSLRGLGLMGHKAEGKFIPRAYLYNSVANRIALLQGLMDTDGCASGIARDDSHFTGVEFATVSRQLAFDVKELVQSLGGRARTDTRLPHYTYNGERRVGQRAYRLYISLPAHIQPFRLPRKLEHYAPGKKYEPTRSIESIEYDGREEAQCILLDSDNHLYVTDEYIVTHNTLQAIALLLHVRSSSNNGTQPALVVCPTSVVGNWRRELQRFAPGLKPHTHQGAERASGEAFVRQLKGVDVVLTSYPLLARDCETLEAVEWSTVILDEAQNIKNSATKQAQAARALPSEHRIALTGTPVENRLTELWSILHFLNPGYLGSEQSFRRRFANPIERLDDAEAARRLKRLTAPFILRRLKTDPAIISDLPDKMEMKVYTTLTTEQGTLYEAVVKDVIERIEGADAEGDDMSRRGLVLSLLMQLKQICNHPAHYLKDGSPLDGRSGKLSRLTEMLEEVYAADDRALVFTQFAEMGELLRTHLRATFYDEPLWLHGGTKVKEREDMIRRFQAERGPTVFILSLKAGGVGLNLTRANHVFHFDRWWNPAVENQATDRAFRIGQTRSVQVHKFVCAGTLEEKIDEMIESKKALAERIVGADESWLTELSTAALRDLVQLREVGE
jgi:SNF2 family DNA or RNA helicase